MKQIEVMNSAFYRHLEFLKSLTKCPCKTCVDLDKLKLKIVAHSAELSFIKVMKRIKPFGKEVIEIHRLLKNSINNDNYILISEQLAYDIKLSKNYEDNLIKFEKGKDNYDGKEMHYLYSSINTNNLEMNLTFAPSFIEVPVVEINFIQWIKRVFNPINLYSYN